MPKFQLSALTWKWLLSILIFLSALLLLSEFRYAFHPLLKGEHGSLGLILNDQEALGPAGQDSNQLRITQITPNSPAIAAGAQLGDVLRFDHAIDRWRKFRIGEVLELTLTRGENVRHVRIIASAAPIAIAEYFDYLSRAVLVFPALLFSLLIGFKGANDRAYRAVSLTFIALGFTVYYNFNYSPGNLGFMLSKLAYLATYGLIWFGAAAFVLSYQKYEQTPIRVWLIRLFPWYRTLSGVVAVYSLWFGLGNETPGLWLLGFAGVFGGLLMIFISLVDGARQTKGETRQRHLWLLLSFSFGAFPSMLTWIPELDYTFRGVLLTVILSFIGQFLMYLGLTYAVLRHRIFNFDFAISRALVFSVLSLLLLGVFRLVAWMIVPLLNEGGEHDNVPQQRLMIDAVVAVGVYMVFHQMHGRVVKVVERILFRTWHENEKRLRRFIKEAAHIVSADALLAAQVSAFDHFSGRAGAAIYLRQANGDYSLVTGTLAQAPTLIAADDGLAVTLRSEMALVQDDPTNNIPDCELAFPMSHRGLLNGFVLLGSKPNGASYRPDESSLLGFAVHQVGLDLNALKVEALETELQQLEKHSLKQNAEIQLMAGRRKNGRELLNSDITLSDEQSKSVSEAIKLTQNIDINANKPIALNGDEFSTDRRLIKPQAQFG
jgi:hypothetical protein